MRLGAPFTRNHLKRTEIEMPSRSTFLWTERKYWTARVNEVHGQILPPVENSFGAVRNLEAWGKTKSLEGHTYCLSRLFRAECCLIVLLTFTISWMKFFCNIRQSKLATSMDKGTGKIKQNWMFSKVLGKTCSLHYEASTCSFIYGGSLPYISLLLW